MTLNATFPLPAAVMARAQFFLAPHLVIAARSSAGYENTTPGAAAVSPSSTPLSSLTKLPVFSFAIMADVRSLLRSELASRSAAQSGSSGTRVTKKRKIEASDDVTRKKSRPTTSGLDQTPEIAEDSITPEPDQYVEVATAHDKLQDEEAGPTLENENNDRDTEITASSTKPQQTIDEDEWAAFERDVAAPTHRAQLPPAAVAAATISAAPVSADELAAQQRKRKEDQNLENEDAEGEREDAARHLEEEFEEMEQLEERVKRLKAKREELRRQHVPEEDGLTNAAVEAQNTTQQEGYESEEEDEADADADADWDDWRFR